MVFYIANIYQLLAEANGVQVSIPSSLSNPASSFTPPKYAIWVNALWFLSLAISLMCALLATLMQQWARQYNIRTARLRYSPHNQGRIRAFFAEGIDNLRLPLAVEVLPAFLHLSLFLFFAGLLVFLFNTHHNVFSAVAWWVGLCTATYMFITFMPLFRPDSPHYTPFSSSVWFVATGMLTLVFQLLYWLWPECFSDSAWDHFDERRRYYRSWFVRGLSKTAEEVARKLSPAIDGRALMWTLDNCGEDFELERFFEGIPGFCSSKVLHNPIGACIKPNIERMTEVLIGLVHRTITSNLVAPTIKSRRLVICREAMKAASLRTSPQIFRRIIDGEWDDLLGSFEFGLFLGNADNIDPVTAYHSQAILSIILPKVPERERDERWFQLATRHLGFPRPVLAHYLGQGDSMSFATSIRILRNIIHTHFDPFWLGEAATRWKVLELVTKFDVQGTLPTLQHDFCDLWNELVHMAKSGDPRRRSISIAILRNVRNAYIVLHHGTDSAPTAFSSSTADDDHALILLSSYPTCNVTDHHPHGAPPTAHPRFIPGPQQGQLVPNLTSTATTMSASQPAETSPSTPHFYVNISTTPQPHSVIPDTLTFPWPIPALDDTGPPLGPQSATDPAISRSDHVHFDPSTSLTTFSVAAPRQTSALDRPATVDGKDNAEVAFPRDSAAGPPSADPVTTVTAPNNSVRSPQPPPPRSSTDEAIPSPSLSSRDAEKRGDQLRHSLDGESTSKT
jgi:hypothetical protein